MQIAQMGSALIGTCTSVTTRLLASAREVRGQTSYRQTGHVRIRRGKCRSRGKTFSLRIKFDLFPIRSRQIPSGQRNETDEPRRRYMQELNKYVRNERHRSYCSRRSCFASRKLSGSPSVRSVSIRVMHFAVFHKGYAPLQ